MSNVKGLHGFAGDIADVRRRHGDTLIVAENLAQRFTPMIIKVVRNNQALLENVKLQLRELLDANGAFAIDVRYQHLAQVVRDLEEPSAGVVRAEGAYFGIDYRPEAGELVIRHDDEAAGVNEKTVIPLKQAVRFVVNGIALEPADDGRGHTLCIDYDAALGALAITYRRGRYKEVLLEHQFNPATAFIALNGNPIGAHVLRDNLRPQGVQARRAQA